MQEFVTHSWYKYGDECKGLHPWDGVTEPNYAARSERQGHRTSIEAVDEGGKYSFIKAPRWKGNAVEVGPLARWIVGYAQGRPEFKEPADKLLTDLGVPVTALFSTLGRTAARALECVWAAHQLRYFQDKLMTSIKTGDLATANTDKWQPGHLAERGQGRRLHRGAARRARPTG